MVSFDLHARWHHQWLCRGAGHVQSLAADARSSFSLGSFLNVMNQSSA
jgi:hypothetical protein